MKSLRRAITPHMVLVSSLIIGLLTFLVPTAAVASGTLANPDFVFSEGSNASVFKVTFAPDLVNAASYTVKIYDSDDSYAAVRMTVNNYVSGTDIAGVTCDYFGGGTDTNFCLKINRGVTFKASITANPNPGVTGPGESAKSNTIGILFSPNPVGGAVKNDQNQPGMYFHRTDKAISARSAATYTLYLYRTNIGAPTGLTNVICATSDPMIAELANVYATHTGLNNSTGVADYGDETFLALEPGYCYMWASKMIAPLTPDSANITWYDSDISVKARYAYYVPRQITPPTSLQVVPGDKQLALSWTAPTSTSVNLRCYDILISTDLSNWYYVVRAGFDTITSFPNNITSLNATQYYYLDGYTRKHDLVNGTPYYIRIIAWGDFPDYKQSVDLYTSPTTFTPASPPFELPTTGISPKDGQVDFTWSAPTDNGGAAVTGYVGDFSTDNTNWSGGFKVSASTYAASITGLTNGTAYYFRIAAKNSIGIGTYSNSGTTTTPYGTPTISMSVTSIDGTSATVSISGNSKGRSVTPSISWGTVGDSQTTVSYTPIKSDSYSNTLTLTGLVPGSHYQVNASASYVAYSQNISADTGATRFTTTPGTVSNLSVISGGNSLIASWDSMTNPPSALISYEVHAAINDVIKGTGCAAVTSSSGGRSSCTVTGLTATTAYAVVVTASISGGALGNGTGNPSSVFVTTKTPQTITFDLSALPSKVFGDSSFNISSYLSIDSGKTIEVTSATAAVCTISNYVVTLVGPGACALAANQSGDSTYGAAAQVYGFIAVSKQPQTISFSVAGVGSKAVGASPFSVTATSTSGLTVVIKSVTLDVCTVSTNTVTLLTSGTCTLYANQSGTDTYAAAASVSQLISISKGSQTSTIDFSGLSSKALGDSSFSISSYVTTSSGLTPTLTSDTTDICTITTSTVSIVSAGTCTIRVAVGENANYLSAADVTASFTIGKTRQTISFSLSSFTKSFGDSPFSMSATSSSSLTVMLTTTTSSVCSISDRTLTILTGGTCTVKANQSGDATYGPAAEVSQDLVIAKIDQTITFSLSSLPAVKRADSPVSINSFASVTSGLTVGFTSGTTSICTISGSTITPVSVGTCTITAAQTGNESYNVATGVSASFVVGKTSQTISLTVPSKTYGDAAFDLTPIATSGLTVSLTTSTASICSVSGMAVTIVAAGTCVVIANQAGNSSYSAASQVSSNLVISKANQTITFPDLPAKSYGAIAFVIPNPATTPSSLTITYASTTTSICTNVGLVVTILEVGTCTISASQSGDDNYNAASSVSKSLTISKATQSISFPSISDHTLLSNNFTATTSASSGLTVTLTSTTLSICTISGFVVSLMTTGTCSITASQSGDSHFESADSVVAAFDINGKIDVVLSNFPDENKTYGDSPFTIAAPTASVPGTFTYSSNNTYILPISGATATIGYVGTVGVTATFTPTVTSSYNGALITKTFTIAQGVQDPLTIAATSGNSGSTLYLSTTGGTGFGYVSYSLSSSTGCSLESWGALSRTGEGDCYVIANKATDGVHAEINSAISKITFTKRAQTISFSLDSSGPQTYGAWPIWIFGNSSAWLPLTLTSNDTTVCSLNGSTLSFNKPGICSITASQSGDDTISAATPVTSTLTVNKAALTVSFANVDITAGDPFDPSLLNPSFTGFVYYPALENVTALGGSLSCSSTYTTSSSSGNYPITCSGYTSANYEITYASPTLHAASVLDGGLDGGLGGGSGGVSLLEQRITFQDLSGLHKTLSDAPFSISQYASNSAPLQISFSAKSMACSVSGDVVTLIGLGNCVILASAQGNTQYSDAISVIRTFEVLAASTPTVEIVTPVVVTPVVVTPTPEPEPIRVVIDPAIIAAQEAEAARLLEIHIKIVNAQTIINQQQQILKTVQKIYRSAVLKANVAYYKELAGQHGNFKRYLEMKALAKAKLVRATAAAGKSRDLTIKTANTLIAVQKSLIDELTQQG